MMMDIFWLYIIIYKFLIYILYICVNFNSIYIEILGKWKFFIDNCDIWFLNIWIWIIRKWNKNKVRSN